VTDWSEIRTHFPALEAQVYLNTAGGGPMSREAVEAVRHYYDEFYEHGDTGWEFWLGRVESVRARLARMLGVTPDEVAFLANASSGLNHVADLLAGDDGTVAVLDGEFPSVTFPWSSRGRRLHFMKSTAAIEDLPSSTSVLAVSHVQYQTGERLDLARVSEICAARDVRLVVDATQSFGVHPIDLAATPVDALVFSGYKWANAGYGIAPLYVRRSLLGGSGPRSAGWRSAPEPYDLDERSTELTTTARGLELGHPPFAGVASLGGALELIEQVGLEAIDARVQSLQESLRRGLHDKRLEVRSKPGSGITMVGVDDPVATVGRLAETNVLVSARGAGIRISVHYYNSERDLEQLLESI